MKIICFSYRTNEHNKKWNIREKKIGLKWNNSNESTPNVCRVLSNKFRFECSRAHEMCTGRKPLRKRRFFFFLYIFLCIISCECLALLVDVAFECVCVYLFCMFRLGGRMPNTLKLSLYTGFNHTEADGFLMPCYQKRRLIYTNTFTHTHSLTRTIYTQHTRFIKSIDC